jgi:hypothetical protein
LGLVVKLYPNQTAQKSRASVLELEFRKSHGLKICTRALELVGKVFFLHSGIDIFSNKRMDEIDR